MYGKYIIINKHLNIFYITVCHLQQLNGWRECSYGHIENGEIFKNLLNLGKSSENLQHMSLTFSLHPLPASVWWKLYSRQVHPRGWAPGGPCHWHLMGLPASCYSGCVPAGATERTGLPAPMGAHFLGRCCPPGMAGQEYWALKHPLQLAYRWVFFFIAGGASWEDPGHYPCPKPCS